MVIEFIAMLWWTIAVVLIICFIMADTQANNKEIILAFAGCLSWPVLLPFVLVGLLYQALVASAKQIRTDIKNRKLLKEFEEFLEERKHSKILPKDDK
jgi:uncharacterized integral membrane protein